VLLEDGEDWDVFAVGLAVGEEGQVEEGDCADLVSED